MEREKAESSPPHGAFPPLPMVAARLAPHLHVPMNGSPSAPAIFLACGERGEEKEKRERETIRARCVSAPRTRSCWVCVVGGAGVEHDRSDARQCVCKGYREQERTLLGVRRRRQQQAAAARAASADGDGERRERESERAAAVALFIAAQASASCQFLPAARSSRRHRDLKPRASRGKLRPSGGGAPPNTPPAPCRGRPRGRQHRSPVGEMLRPIQPGGPAHIFECDVRLRTAGVKQADARAVGRSRTGRF